MKKALSTIILLFLFTKTYSQIDIAPLSLLNQQMWYLNPASCFGEKNQTNIFWKDLNGRIDGFSFNNLGANYAFRANKHSNISLRTEIITQSQSTIFNVGGSYALGFDLGEESKLAFSATAAFSGWNKNFGSVSQFIIKPDLQGGVFLKIKKFKTGLNVQHAFEPTYNFDRIGRTDIYSRLIYTHIGVEEYYINEDFRGSTVAIVTFPTSAKGDFNIIQNFNYKNFHFGLNYRYNSFINSNFGVHVGFKLEDAYALFYNLDIANKVNPTRFHNEAHANIILE